MRNQMASLEELCVHTREFVCRWKTTWEDVVHLLLFVSGTKSTRLDLIGYPPISSKVGAKPCSSAMSMNARADAMASPNGPESWQPLPTWNETPTTSSPSSLARPSRAPHSLGAAPNLELKRQTDLESSTAMRITTRASGNTAAIFSSSG